MQNPNSAEDQVRLCIERCQRHGWRVTLTAKDEALTGRTTAKRTGYFQVMAAAEAGEIDVIVIEDISRLGRDAAELLLAARRLSESGVVIYTLGGGVIDGLELAIRAQMAQEQSEETARRVKRGHRSAAAKGRVIGGIAYGYCLRDELDEHGGRREIDNGEAKNVVRIYKDLAAGMSPLAICAALNAEGVRPPGGGKLWRPKAISGDRHLQTGIGRNPLYAGRLVFGKSNSRLIASTGKVKVTPGPLSEQIEKEVSHLRILDDELWHTVQTILDDRSQTVPNNARQPSYLLSGKITCGVCGSSYSMVGSALGCTGRRYGSGCTNQRRAPRQDLEREVLIGLEEKILQPHILELYLSEYRQELDKAAAEYADRNQSTQSRIEELDREIANVLALARAGSAGGAAALLNQELERLYIQRKQLDREARRPERNLSLPTTTEAVIERLKALLASLGDALNGPERDAARARDLIRSFITTVKITPLGKADGHGAGPVRATVEGSLSEFLGQATADRKIQRRGSTAATLDLPNVAFEFYVDLTRENSDAEGVYPDLAVFSRLLDDAYAPVATEALAHALNDYGRAATSREKILLENRAHRTIFRLQRLDAIRSIRLPAGAGWVWNDRAISDDEWRRRAADAVPPAPPISVIRLTPPSAYVVIIKPGDLPPAAS